MRTTLDILRALIEEARTGAGSGTRGVSLFLVEAMRNEVALGEPMLHRERLTAICGY